MALKVLSMEASKHACLASTLGKLMGEKLAN